MFNFASLFSLLRSVPAVITEFETLASDPVVQNLEALIAKNFTHTTTAGAAVVLEPLGTTTNTGATPAVGGDHTK